MHVGLVLQIEVLTGVWGLDMNPHLRRTDNVQEACHQAAHVHSINNIVRLIKFYQTSLQKA